MHIPYFLASAQSARDSIEFKNFALQTLANLAKREQMRPYILYNEGLKVFVDKLRDETNMTGRRIAAEALNDICS